MMIINNIISIDSDLKEVNMNILTRIRLSYC